MEPDDALGFGESPTAERIDEHLKVTVIPQEEVAGKPHARQRHSATPSNFDRHDRQRDRDAQTPVQDSMQIAVVGVVVVDAVSCETAIGEQCIQKVIEGRARHRLGKVIDSRKRRAAIKRGIAVRCEQYGGFIERPVGVGHQHGEAFEVRRPNFHTCRVVGDPWRGSNRYSHEMGYPGDHAATHPDRPAYIMATSGEVITYGQLDAAANRLASVFMDAGLQPGDHVAICMENHRRYLEVVWGCTYAGLIFTACSSRLTAGELSYIINDCGARAYITSLYKADQAAEVVTTTPGVELRLMLDGVIPGYDSYEATVDHASAEPRPDRVQGTDMLYSSGTTGKPKGVAQAWNPVPLGTSPALVGLLGGLFGFTPDSVYLSPAPLYHAAPLRFCLAAHDIGGTVIVMDQFDPEQSLALIERYRITHSQWVPTMFVRMLKQPQEIRDRYDVSSLKVAIHAAAPCPIPVKRQMIEWWGPVLHEYYAGTEGNGFVYCNSEMWLAHPGTVGVAVTGTLHIVDDAGNDVPTGESGTVFFEGGGSFEYHNDPEKTASSRDPRGWSTLGDVGHLDADKYLYLTDRKAYMIISGGVNIYPQEAENLLVTHSSVVDVAVFGVPNEEFGEEVKAVVQPVTMPTNADDAKLLEQQLIAFCRTELSPIKCPRSIDFREELPRHPTGKLYKRLLKDEYWPAATP